MLRIQYESAIHLYESFRVRNNQIEIPMFALVCKIIAIKSLIKIG